MRIQGGVGSRFGPPSPIGRTTPRPSTCPLPPWRWQVSQVSEPAPWMSGEPATRSTTLPVETIAIAPSVITAMPGWSRRRASPPLREPTFPLTGRVRASTGQERARVEEEDGERGPGSGHHAHGSTVLSPPAAPAGSSAAPLWLRLPAHADVCAPARTSGWRFGALAGLALVPRVIRAPERAGPAGPGVPPHRHPGSSTRCAAELSAELSNLMLQIQTGSAGRSACVETPPTSDRGAGSRSERPAGDLRPSRRGAGSPRPLRAPAALTARTRLLRHAPQREPLSSPDYRSRAARAPPAKSAPGPPWPRRGSETRMPAGARRPLTMAPGDEEALRDVERERRAEHDRHVGEGGRRVSAEDRQGAPDQVRRR